MACPTGRHFATLAARIPRLPAVVLRLPICRRHAFHFATSLGEDRAGSMGPPSANSGLDGAHHQLRDNLAVGADERLIAAPVCAGKNAQYHILRDDGGSGFCLGLLGESLCIWIDKQPQRARVLAKQHCCHSGGCVDPICEGGRWP